MFPAEFNGVLFFGDYAQGWIKYLTLDGAGNSTGVFDFYPGAGSVVDMHVSPTDGSLYYITYIPAAIYRITYSTGNQIPSASAGSDVISGISPLTVHFSSTGSNDPDGDPLTYLWNFGDGTQSTSPNPTHVYNNNGRYTVQLKVSDPVSSALAFPFIVQVGTPPTVSISSPANNSNYIAGDTINYTAAGTDSTGASLPDSAFTTTVVFHHQTHIHPFLGPLASARTGSFTVPLSGEASAESWFEINMTATDSGGLSTTKSVAVYPLVVNFTYATSTPGLNILLDGIPTPAQTIQSVVNYQHEVSLNGAQNLNGVYYIPDHWSDSGAIAHNSSIPSADGTLTAFFNQLPAFAGEYFNNTTLTGSPTFTRQDSFVDFNWAGASPGSGLSGSNFSVRWVGSVSFMSGNYTFVTTSDDGVRFYIDGNLLIDQWHDQGTTSYSAAIDLTGGTHELKLEYYQAGGGSVAKLNWDLTGNPSIGVPNPSPNPNPNPTPTPNPVGNLLTSPWRFTGNNKRHGEPKYYL